MRSTAPLVSFWRALVGRHAHRALALVAVCALALATWSAVGSYQKRHLHYRHQAERQLQTINHLQAQRVQQWRDQHLTDALQLSDDPLLERAVARWRQAPDAQQQALLVARLRTLQEHNRYTAVYLLDAQGAVLLSLSELAQKPLPAPERQALQNALSSARPQMSEPRQDTALFAFPFISVLAPLFDGSEPAGAVWLVSDVRASLYPLLAPWRTLSETAESSLVARSGTETLYLSPRRHPGATEAAPRVALAHTQDPGTQALAGVRGVFYGQDLGGEQVMAAASAVPASPWHVVTSISTTEVFAQTRKREILALSLPISLGLLCAGLVFAVLQRRGWLRERDLKAQVQRNMRWLENAQKTAAMGHFAYEPESAGFTLSSMACDIFGVGDSSMAQEHWLRLVHPGQRSQVLEQHQRTLSLRTPLKMQYRICRTSDQSTRWLQVWGECETQGQGSGLAVTRLIGTVQDITERKAAELALADYRNTLEATVRLDPLTQIANRRALDEHVALHWQRALHSHRALSLLMVDVDHFKQYNDHYGHVEGDACLQRVAHALTGVVARAHDLVARYGGEEFAIVLPDTEAAQAHVLARKICAAVQAQALPHARSGTASCVTVSVGVACVHPAFNGARPDSTETGPLQTGQAPANAIAQALFEPADAALYLAKQRGRNRAELQSQPQPQP